MSDTPALLQVDGTRISIHVLARTPWGTTMVEGRGFMHIGDVRKTTAKSDKGFTTLWRWSDVSGSKGTGATKAKAIEAMLAFSGFREAAIEETIPDLLAGL